VQYTAPLILIGAADSTPQPHQSHRQHSSSLLVHQTIVIIFTRAAVIYPLYWCKLHITLLHLISAADSTPNLSSLSVQEIALLILISEVKTALFHLIGAANSLLILIDEQAAFSLLIDAAAAFPRPHWFSRE
jgi:hypothetical protein